MNLLLCCPALVLALLAPASIPTDVLGSRSIANPADAAAVIRKFKEKDPGLTRMIAEAEGVGSQKFSFRPMGKTS